jgi:hypothetical protein
LAKRGIVLRYLIDFIENEKIEETFVYSQLKCDIESTSLLKVMTQKYIKGQESIVCSEALSEMFGSKNYKHISKLGIVKNLIERLGGKQRQLWGAKN